MTLVEEDKFRNDCDQYVTCTNESPTNLLTSMYQGQILFQVNEEMW